MWLLLQQEEPDDYVIATNETRTVREFAKTAFAAAGIEVEFEGEGVNESTQRIRQQVRLYLRLIRTSSDQQRLNFLLVTQLRQKQSLAGRERFLSRN